MILNRNLFLFSCCNWRLICCHERGLPLPLRRLMCYLGRWLLLWFLVVFGLLFPFCCFLLLFEGWSSTLKVLFISCYCKLCCCCCGGSVITATGDFYFFWFLVCGISGWDSTTYTVIIAASWETRWLFPHVACWCYCCVCCWDEAIGTCFKLLLYVVARNYCYIVPESGIRCWSNLLEWKLLHCWNMWLLQLMTVASGVANRDCCGALLFFQVLILRKHYKEENDINQKSNGLTCGQ
jgi:hypothetical protein